MLQHIDMSLYRFLPWSVDPSIVEDLEEEYVDLDVELQDRK
jgi:hypothetical protein